MTYDVMIMTDEAYLCMRGGGMWKWRVELETRCFKQQSRMLVNKAVKYNI